MIPAQAVEAARIRLVELRADGAKAAMWRTDDIDALVSALEAAAPHMHQLSPDVEDIEEKVKLIVQDVAMTVDYTERLYSAVQEIMAATGLKPTDAR